MTAKLRDPVLSVCLVVFSFFLYWSCRQAAFIWDDQFLVVKNPLIRSPVLAFESFRHFLGEEPASNFYRPIQTLTYLADYWRGGLDATNYHDGSVLIHAGNAILLYIFVRGILQREAAASEKNATVAAVLVALSWLAHPIHSATVAYIAGRADSLALFFLLTGWCLWDRFLQTRGKMRWVYGGAIFLSGFLAIGSKEAALIGIGIFLVWNLYSGKSLTIRQKTLLLIASLALVGIYLLLRTSIGASEASQATGPLGNRPTLVIRALGDYLRILLFPGNLRMERQIVMVPNLFCDPASFDPLYPYLAISGLLFIGLLLISVVRRGAYLRVRRFGLFWFVASILPVSNVFVLNATIAEHWLYIPSIGFFIILAGWVLETPPKIQRMISLFAVGAVIALAMRTKIRALDWSSPTIFFAATIRDGGDTARMRVNLANEYQIHGNPKRGEKLLRSVLALNPSYAQARHALVMNLLIQGRTNEANALFANEKNPFGSSFRGKLYAVQRLTNDRQVAEASKILKELRQQYPDSWLLTVEIGRLFDKMGQPEQKIALYKSFAENHWWHAESHVELGKLYETTKHPQAAAENYRQAARLDVRDTALRARSEALLQLRDSS